MVELFTLFEGTVVDPDMIFIFFLFLWSPKQILNRHRALVVCVHFPPLSMKIKCKTLSSGILHGGQLYIYWQTFMAGGGIQNIISSFCSLLLNNDIQL